MNRTDSLKNLSNRIRESGTKNVVLKQKTFSKKIKALNQEPYAGRLASTVLGESLWLPETGLLSYAYSRDSLAFLPSFCRTLRERAYSTQGFRFKHHSSGSSLFLQKRIRIAAQRHAIKRRYESIQYRILSQKKFRKKRQINLLKTSSLFDKLT